MAGRWKKLSDDALKARVFAALEGNVNYQEQNVFGVPASRLDEKVFHRDASFLKDAPFLSTLMENPNHIGCHTLEMSEPYFEGTQRLERELIELCACDILRAIGMFFTTVVVSVRPWVCCLMSRLLFRLLLISLNICEIK